MATGESEILLDMEATSECDTLFDMKEWIVDMEASANCPEEEEEVPLWKTASIYKVPSPKRKLHPEAFTPKFVSFGPIHNCDNTNSFELLEMEEKKVGAFLHFLKRAKHLRASNSQNREDLPLENIVQEIYRIITPLREAYSGCPEMSDDKFLQIMIVDGCFMLELLRFSGTSEREYMDSDCYFTLDGIFQMWPYIIRDMLLIENQLPLFLLEALAPFQMTRSPQDKFAINRYINTSVLNFISGFMSEGENTNTSTTPGDEGTEANTNIHKLLYCGLRSSKNTTTNTTVRDATNTPKGVHALDLFRKSLLSPTYDKPIQKHRPSNRTTFYIDPQLIRRRCATKLHEAGVCFKKSETNSLQDISFDPKAGEFNLPFLVVDDSTESIFLNILSFERWYGRLNRDVTTYICVMDALIDSAKDVSLLSDKGLIANMLGSDEQVAALFNMIAKEGVDVGDSNLSLMWENVFIYCSMKRNKWRAKRNIWIENFINTYFASPWSALSLAGALLVIGLTFIQTIYAIHGK